LLFYISNDKLTLIECFYKLNSFLHKYIIYIRGACSKYCEAWSGGLMYMYVPVDQRYIAYHGHWAFMTVQLSIASSLNRHDRCF